MIFDFPLAGGAGSLVVVAGAEAAESFDFQLEGFVAVGVGGSVGEYFVWFGVEGFGMYPWLIL